MILLAAVLAWLAIILVLVNVNNALVTAFNVLLLTHASNVRIVTSFQTEIV